MEADQIGMRDRKYIDSTPQLHVGDSAFEDWFQAHPRACEGGGIKQMARDAYAAGMGDPMVLARAQLPASAPAVSVDEELSDEDIQKIADQVVENDPQVGGFLVAFARAIQRAEASKSPARVASESGPLTDIHVVVAGEEKKS